MTLLEVVIFAADTPLKFDTGAGANEGYYTYNPEGIPTGEEGTILNFPTNESATVTLPSGTEYTFKTSGKDAVGEWFAYGETTKTVTVSSNSVNLTLKTLLNTASIDAESSQYLVAPGDVMDFYLEVLSPGNYAVPFDDYTVTYAISEGDGEVLNDGSKQGARVTPLEAQASNSFKLTATITGWIIAGGKPVEGTISAAYTTTLSVNTGFTLDSTAPTPVFNDPHRLPVGASATLSGTVSDASGVKRV